MYKPTLRAVGCAAAALIVLVVASIVALRDWSRRRELDDWSKVDEIVHCRALLALGEFEAATEAARAVVRDNETDVEAQLCLADVLAARGNWKEALESYLEAARLGPNDFEAHRGAANALSALDDTLGAERELRECVRIAPLAAEARMNLASNLAVQKRFAEAIDEMKRADELGSQRPYWNYPTKDWIAEFERELLEHGDAPDTPAKR